MGVRIIEGTQDGGPCTAAVLYCSTTMWAFGPVMENWEQAERFLVWMRVQGHKDPRLYKDSELERLYGKFREQDDKKSV